MKTPPTRWNPWPASIIGFFVLALLGCGTLVAFCNRHPADLVAADYYEQELRYQGRIDGLQHTRQEGLAASVSYDPSAQRIIVALPAARSSAKPTGRIQLYRPSAIGQDQELKLEPNDNGIQAIDATGLAPGLWKVRVAWTLNHEDYFTDEKLNIRSPATASDRASGRTGH